MPRERAQVILPPWVIDRVVTPMTLAFFAGYLIYTRFSSLTYLAWFRGIIIPSIAIFFLLTSYRPQRTSVTWRALLAIALFHGVFFFERERSIPIKHLGTVFGYSSGFFAVWLLWSYLNLRRNLAIVPAVRNLVSTGPYRYVRHPIYAAWIMTSVYYILAFPTWRNLLLGTLVILGCGMRIQEEEKIWGNPQYDRYRKATPRQWFHWIFIFPTLPFAVLYARYFLNL